MHFFEVFRMVFWNKFFWSKSISYFVYNLAVSFYYNSSSFVLKFLLFSSLPVFFICMATLLHLFINSSVCSSSFICLSYQFSRKIQFAITLSFSVMLLICIIFLYSNLQQLIFSLVMSFINSLNKNVKYVLFPFGSQLYFQLIVSRTDISVLWH